MKKIKSLHLIVGISFLNALFIFTICIGVMPFVKNVYWQPFVRSSEYVQKQIEHVSGGNFATMGLSSPTVSSSFTLGYVQQFSKSDDGAFQKHTTYILLPKWLEGKCSKYNYEIVRQDYYLSVCRLK